MTAKHPTFDNTSLNSLGSHMLFGAIDQSTSNSVCEFILKSSMLGAESCTLYLNTEGGECTDGFAIIDCMEASRIPVKTVSIGMVASMGVLIAAAGHKGSRIMTKNTEVMAHQFAAYFGGKQHELVAVQDSFKRLEQSFITHFLRHSKMSEKQVRDILFSPSDRYLTPAECKKYGLVDKVVEYFDGGK